MLDDEEVVQPISIGSIEMGYSPWQKAWREAISHLSAVVVHSRPYLQTSLNINVVFHRPGSILKPEFTGARTGSYRKADDLLMVQVALPWEPPEQVNEYLRRKLELALDETEQWITRRKKSQYDLSTLREFVRTLPLQDPPSRL